MANLPLVLRELGFERSSFEYLTDNLSLQHRVEALAKDYLEGGRLVIFSATLRGPFQPSWTSPWHNLDEAVIASCPASADAVNGNPAMDTSRPLSTGFIPINHRRHPLTPAIGNVQVNNKLGTQVQRPEMAKSPTLTEKVAQHVMSVLEANQDSGITGNNASKLSKRKQGKTYSKYKIQIYEDPEDTFVGVENDVKPSSVYTNSAATTTELRDPVKQPSEVTLKWEDEGLATHPELDVSKGHTYPNTTDRDQHENRVMEIMWPGGCLKTAYDFHGRLIYLFDDEADARLQQLLKLSPHRSELAIRKTEESPLGRVKQPKNDELAPQDSEVTTNFRKRKPQRKRTNRRASSGVSEITRSSKRTRRHTQASSSINVSVNKKSSTEPYSLNLSLEKLPAANQFSSEEQWLSPESYGSPQSNSSKKQARFSDKYEVIEFGQPVKPSWSTDSQNSLLKSIMKKTNTSITATTSEHSAPTAASDCYVESRTAVTDSDIETQRDDHSSIAVLISSSSSEENLDYLGPLVDEIINQDLAIDLV